VHLVDDEVLDPWRIGGPSESRGIDYLRWTPNTFWLETGAGVGATFSIEQHVVVVPGGGFDDVGVDAVPLGLEDLVALTGKSDGY
jgi:hypothetical protein